MIENALGGGKTVANASKADLLSAVCAAIKANPAAAPQIARVAATARPDLAQDILRTAFRCASSPGNQNCQMLGRILRAVQAAVPDQASSLMNLAVELAPDCANSFPPSGPPGGDVEGNFGNPPGNQNPAPGTIGGGGGGQGTVVAVCFNGTTRFFTPEGAQAFLNANPGARLGACVVTPVTNP